MAVINLVPNASTSLVDSRHKSFIKDSLRQCARLVKAFGTKLSGYYFIHTGWPGHQSGPLWGQMINYQSDQMNELSTLQAKRILMLTLKQADVRLRTKQEYDSLCLILGQTLTGS